MEEDPFQQVKDRLTQALITGNFALYRSVISLPFQVEPRDGKPYVLHSETALEEDFLLYHKVINLHRITDIVREVKHMMKLQEDWVEVTVETNLLSHADRVVGPFKTQFVLRKTPDQWRIASIRSSLGHINWTMGRAEITDQKVFKLNGHPDLPDTET